MTGPSLPELERYQTVLGLIALGLPQALPASEARVTT